MATATRTQAERSQRTTGGLVAAARERFASDGYAATSLQAVVAEAGVTKGALYHHLGGKRELFEAVFVAEQQRLSAGFATAYAAHDDPIEGAFAGFRAFLEASLDPGVQRITLLDAPSVLGWERMREIQKDLNLALIEIGVRECIAAGRIRARKVEPFSHLIFGLLCEGAMYIARCGDQRAAMGHVEHELRMLLDGFVAQAAS